MRATTHHDKSATSFVKRLDSFCLVDLSNYQERISGSWYAFLGSQLDPSLGKFERVLEHMLGTVNTVQ
jgi:hypothetical protein